MVIHYALPAAWIAYDQQAVFGPLLEAKAAITALTAMPYQRAWADQLQEVQLKREVAGTSRIEGAEFTESELDAALSETPEQLHTRSQRQAASAVAAYRWIARLPVDIPLDLSLILNIHRRLVAGCDDDHCPPGELRRTDQNVTFGAPRHRGIDGGQERVDALEGLVESARTTFRAHDPLIQALALHYHLASMHPFLDGNGRTARALEALMLRRVGLRDTLFIAMSNYYYEEKTAYLQALNETRARDHDLTPFLAFALKGIALQCQRLFQEIRTHVAKALFRNTATDLFGRVRSPRKRVVSARQLQVLMLLLDAEPISLSEIERRTLGFYTVANPIKALYRDLNVLLRLRAITLERAARREEQRLRVNLEWPAQITESEFFRRVKSMPAAKGFPFLNDEG